MPARYRPGGIARMLAMTSSFSLTGSGSLGELRGGEVDSSGVIVT
jgi:hypothetical protein